MAKRNFGVSAASAGRCLTLSFLSCCDNDGSHGVGAAVGSCAKTCNDLVEIEIPHGVKVVDVSVWRQQAYRRGTSASEGDRAKQQAFKRASEHLIAAGRVGMWDSLVWAA
jgi:hypothetical protein